MKTILKQVIKIKYKLKEIMKTKRGSLHQDKMSKIFYQPLSNIFLWFFLNLGVSANGVGFIMAFISIIAAGLFLTGIKINLIIGIILFIVAIVLDHTDGDVARITKKFSKKGVFLDHIHHNCEDFFFFVGIGLYLMKTTNNNLFFIMGLIITLLMLIPNHFRARIYWLLSKGESNACDVQYRKMPFVLLYGDFFKIWHFLLLFAFLFDKVDYLMYLALIWSIIRFFPKIYVLYKECDLYDREEKKGKIK